MKRQKGLSATLTGIAGEYFVAAELSRRGDVASLTLRNTRGIDILVSNADATKSVGIQVKCKQGRGSEWVLTEKIEREAAENLFFVFVALDGIGAPQYYIVPRDVVVKYCIENHGRWLQTPGRRGQPHKDNPMRKFRDEAGEYRDRWEMLGLEPVTRHALGSNQVK